MVFGMIPSKYIAGSNLMQSGMGLYGAGVNLSGLYGTQRSGLYGGSVSGGGRINYYTGKPVGASVAATVQPNVPTAVSNNAQTQNTNQNLNIQNQDNFTPTSPDAKILNMQLILENTKNEQGAVGKFFDGIKGFTGLGLSSKKCQKLIDAAKTGQLPVDTAYDKVSKFSVKQKTAVNAFSGILASALAIFAASRGTKKGINIKNILAAAGVGASVKAGIKTFDRATNNIKQDALDAKLIAKDGLSGAINGAATYALTGINKNSTMVGKSMGASVGKGAINGLKLGAASGAIMGASDYSLDCAFDENQKFNPSDFMQATAYSAAAGGLTGAVVGGITGGVMHKKLNPKQSTPNQQVEPKAEPKVEPKTGAKTEPKAEPKTEPKVEPKAQDKAQTQVKPKVEDKPKVKPKTEPKAEPKVEPKTGAKAEPKTESKAEPKKQVKPENKIEPKGVKKDEAQSKNKVINFKEEAEKISGKNKDNGIKPVEAQNNEGEKITPLKEVKQKSSKKESVKSVEPSTNETDVKVKDNLNSKEIKPSSETVIEPKSGVTENAPELTKPKTTENVPEQPKPQAAENMSGQKNNIIDNVSDIYKKSSPINNGQNISDNVAGVYNTVQDKTALNHNRISSGIATVFKRK